MGEEPFIPTGSLDGWRSGKHLREHGRPAEFEYEREATAQQLADLEDWDYQGWPIPWGYITTRQAGILLARLAKGEPLWQPTGEKKAAPAAMPASPVAAALLTQPTLF